MKKLSATESTSDVVRIVSVSMETQGIFNLLLNGVNSAVVLEKAVGTTTTYRLVDCWNDENPVEIKPIKKDD